MSEARATIEPLPRQNRRVDKAPRWITTDIAVEEFQISRTYVRWLFRNGRIEAEKRKTGQLTYLLINADSLAEYLHEHPKNPGRTGRPPRKTHPASSGEGEDH